MKKTARVLTGLVLMGALSLVGTSLLRETAHSQEKEADEEMTEVLDALDEISEELERLEELEGQLEKVQNKLDGMDRRLTKMERVQLKTWDFVYKIRIPGGESPPETADMQDEIGPSRYD